MCARSQAERERALMLREWRPRFLWPSGSPIVRLQGFSEPDIVGLFPLGASTQGWGCSSRSSIPSLSCAWYIYIPPASGSHCWGWGLAPDCTGVLPDLLGVASFCLWLWQSARPVFGSFSGSFAFPALVALVCLWEEVSSRSFSCSVSPAPVKRL